MELNKQMKLISEISAVTAPKKPFVLTGSRERYGERDDGTGQKREREGGKRKKQTRRRCELRGKQPREGEKGEGEKA